MFGAIYFGETYFAGSYSVATTPPCSANYFGGFYFGQMPVCWFIVPLPAPIVPPVPPPIIVGGGGGGVLDPYFPRHRPLDRAYKESEEECELIRVLLEWLERN
jgi:hypothetical protein